MAELKPFRALRPLPDKVGSVIAPPYDVVDVTEARRLGGWNPDSFLHVSRPEMDLPDGAEPAQVHARGVTALAEMQQRGVLVRDQTPTLSIYRQRYQGSERIGVVGGSSVADYRSGVIAVHERTRQDKEDDRTAHVNALDAHDEPVLLMYPGRARIDAAVAAASDRPADLEATDADDVQHSLWTVSDPALIQELVDAFAELPRLYVADGHHRSAAAARLHDLRADEADAGETAYFPTVAFPAEQLLVLPYQRVVSQLNGYDVESLLAALGDRFEMCAEPDGGYPADLDRHQFALYLGGGHWYRLTAGPDQVDENDPIGRLDVSVLQDRVLDPLLGIADPRTDPKIGFVGGSRGSAELERLVDSGRYRAAFGLYPTSAAEVMAVAELGLVMPPKSTWFEPKLGSGLFVHPLH